VEEIDPIYFERSYYLLPQEGGEKVYALLARAMEDARLTAELGMARALIDRFTGQFDRSKYKDTYTDRLLEVIEQKRKGETVTVETPAEPDQLAPDLMTALKATIEAHGRSRRRSSAKRKTSPKAAGQTRRPKTVAWATGSASAAS